MDKLLMRGRPPTLKIKLSGNVGHVRFHGGTKLLHKVHFTLAVSSLEPGGMWTPTSRTT
jgi:hypothetical protein